MVVCAVAASKYPWVEEEITRHEHLSLVWSQFVNLCYLFEEKFKLVGYNYNAALRALSVEGDLIAVGDGVREIKGALGQHIKRRGRHVHQWYDAHPAVKDFRLFETIKISEEWPGDWPEFHSFYEVARDRVCSEIAAALQETSRIIVRLLAERGSQLVGLIVQHNELIDNSRR